MGRSSDPNGHYDYTEFTKNNDVWSSRNSTVYSAWLRNTCFPPPWGFQENRFFTYLGHCVLWMHGHVPEYVIIWRSGTNTNLFSQDMTMHVWIPVWITIRPITTHNSKSRSLKRQKTGLARCHENTQLQPTRLITWKHTERGTMTHTPSFPERKISEIRWIFGGTIIPVAYQRASMLSPLPNTLPDDTHLFILSARQTRCRLRNT
jgi:hypothetical protein